MQYPAPVGSQEPISTGSGQDRSVVMRQLEAVGNYVVICSPALTESRTFYNGDREDYRQSLPPKQLIFRRKKKSKEGAVLPHQLMILDSLALCFW